MVEKKKKIGNMTATNTSADWWKWSHDFRLMENCFLDRRALPLLPFWCGIIDAITPGLAWSMLFGSPSALYAIYRSYTMMDFT